MRLALALPSATGGFTPRPPEALPNVRIKGGCYHNRSEMASRTGFEPVLPT